MLNREEIARRIPHAGTMCLLDEALSWDAAGLRCRSASHRRRPHPLAVDGRLGILNAIEYAAQAMALHGALLAESADGATQPPRAGFLASVRGVDLGAGRLDDLADDLAIEVERLSADGNGALYEFRVAAGERLLAQGRAAVVLDATAQLLAGAPAAAAEQGGAGGTGGRP
jgi:predicted hotdog family 3-hydroxylacyl-ACP dehydratase